MAQSKSGPTDIQRRTERRQQAELTKLQGIETKKTAAAARRTRGRASLISGSERGIVEGDNFQELNRLNRPIAEAKASRLERERTSLLQEQEWAASAPERAESAKRKKEFETRDKARDILNPGLAGTAKFLGVKF